ncbi:MAG: hypothetical protein U1E05_17125, partial [Patescibacteria group bacterium]|nr:hypothetical protein [Patescibacteria group bacterium]
LNGKTATTSKLHAIATGCPHDGDRWGITHTEGRIARRQEAEGFATAPRCRLQHPADGDCG